MLDLMWKIMDEKAPILDRVILLGNQNPQDGKPVRIRELNGRNLEFLTKRQPRAPFLYLQIILYHFKRMWWVEGRLEENWEATNSSIHAAPDGDRVEGQKPVIRWLWRAQELNPKPKLGSHIPHADDTVELAILAAAKLVWAGYRVGVIGR